MALPRILLLLSIVVCWNFVSAQDGVFFTVPKILREGEESEFCLTTYSSSGDSKNVSITMLNKKNPDIAVEINDVYTHGQQKCNNFTVPAAETYEILLYNETDILHDSVDVTVKPHSMITLIQTDKPMYKPGQKVNFRILTIKTDHKPRTGKISAIYIKNPDNSRVKQYLDVDSQGLASLDFQLTKEAKLGRWQILVFLNEADLNANEDGMVMFEVKEYVLPRFEVTIEPPSYILSADTTVEGKVCAKYTYGKDVRGFLELKVCGDEQYYGMPSEPTNCHYEIVEMNGCYNFSVNMTVLKVNGYTSYAWQLKIDASVSEAGTGSIIKATHQGPSLTHDEISLSLKDFTNGYFKPGLPFSGKVIATKPDGTPAADELIRVNAFDYDKTVSFSANFTTDKSGVAHYAFCDDIDGNVTVLTLEAEALNYKDPPKGMYTPMTRGEIKQWFSPSFSYIEVPQIEGKLKCGQTLALKVPFTTKTKTNIEFQYQIISRGKVLTTDTLEYNYENDHPRHSLEKLPERNCLVQEFISKTIPEIIPPIYEPMPPPPMSNSPPFMYPFMPPPMEPFREPIMRSSVIADTVSSFTLNIPVSSVMSPKFSVVVHQVRPDGEIVAGSMEYQVEPCFDNKVNISFDRPTVLPGEDVNLRLEAEPGSVCGVGIVDKSVNLLGGSHQITMDTIYDKIEHLSLNHQPVYSYQNKRGYCETRLKNFLDKETFWHVGSSFVDAKQAFESSGLIVLTNLKLETRPCEVSSPIMASVPMPAVAARGPMPGVVNVPLAMAVSMKTEEKIRSHFPETWLWDLQIVGVNGSLNLPQVAPHTITSWVGNALCMDSDKGVGVSSMQSLTTFQPFFLHLNLPYAAVRGERLPIMYTIHNYMDKCLHMQIRLDTARAFKVHNSYRYRKPFCVCPGKSFTAKFYATPLEIGSLPIVAKARIVPGSCGKSTDVDLTYVGLSDAVKRQMLVKAEGVTKEYTRTLYMCAKENQTKLEDVILPLPEDLVKDSARGDVKVIGDIMGPALTNLDNLVRMPTGCGEQNMVGFTPNIFVLKYLGSTGLLTEEIHDKAVKFMEIGYQRELNYRHRDGSYSAFGKSDERGSVWLTAFVVKSFAQATPYIFIDPYDVEQSVLFLKLSQAENGCFIETGKVFSSYMMGGLGKKSHSTEISLTSYVLISLLQAGVESNETVITEGFQCIDNEFKRVKGRIDMYSLTLWAYASTMKDPLSQTSIEAMKLLESKAKRDGSLKYWNRDGVKQPPSNSYFYRKAPSAEVEMTAYALMAYLNFYGVEAIQHSHEIAMWLSQQRNPYGGFASTQDTVVGVNALSEFAVMAYDDRKVDVNVTVSGKDIEKTFHISEDADTKLLLQKTSISVIPNRIRISASGEGCVLVQANVRFNELPQNFGSHKPGFHLKVMPRRYRHDQDRCDRRTINISVGTRRNIKHSNGMSLVVVKLVTSWLPVEDSLTKLRSLFPVLGMNRIEHNEKENQITFYFDEFQRRPREFALDVEQDREMAVSNPKAGQVSVINYYETDVVLVKSYTLKKTCGTKAEIPRKRIFPQFDPRMPIPVQTRIDFGPVPPLPPLPSTSRTTPVPSTPPTPPPVPSTTVPPPPSSCPICRRLKSLPTGFKDIVCNATYIYKTIAGRRGAYPLKVKQDIRSEKKININKFADFKMPAGCQCLLLKAPATRVFIMTSTPLVGKMLSLDGNSAITYSTKYMEKELRKLKELCHQKKQTTTYKTLTLPTSTPYPRFGLWFR